MEVIFGRSVNCGGVLFRSLDFRSLASSSTVRCLCLYDPKRWDIILYEAKFKGKKSLSTYSYFSQPATLNLWKSKRNISLLYNEPLIRTFSNEITKDKSNNDNNNSTAPQKPNIFQKMKQLTRDYWHILIPVHLATSAVWVSIFYVAAKNGVDIISVMEYIHMPEKYIDMIRNSNAGNWAVTYALYKVFTPLRYTVTVGGTTMSIRYLDRMGYLKFNRRSNEATQSNSPNTTTKEKSSESSCKYTDQSGKRKN